MISINSSGIYTIFNTLDGKFYIGSAVHLAQRFRQHKSGLRLNKHGNSRLQNSWNKYGEDSFKFEIIYECPTNLLLEEEQKFIDNLHPYFNICKIAGSRLGQKMNEESKLLMSLSKIGKPGHWKDKTLTEDHKKKLSEAKKGKRPSNFGIPMSEEQKQKLREANLGKISPMKGKPLPERQKENLRKWHREIGLTTEQREKISSSLKGKPSKKKGIPMSEKQRAKTKGRPLTEDHKRKLKEAWIRRKENANN